MAGKRKADGVAIERRNYFNNYSGETFMIVFGTVDEKKRITDRIRDQSAATGKAR